jgi:hypothetical protein
VRPQHVKVVPAEVERYGGNAAIVLAHIRYRCESDGPGRIEADDDRRWWRVSLADLAHELGMSQKAIRTALRRLSNVVVANHFPPLEDQTLAYRVHAPDQSIAARGTVSNTSDQPVAARGMGPCRQGHGTVPAGASAPYIETLETKETKNASRSSSRKRSRRSENRSAANIPDNAETRLSDHTETPTLGEQAMKQSMARPDQSLLPGMLVTVPESEAERGQLPATVAETTPAKPSRAERGTRLPDNWQPPRKLVAEMHVECPEVDQGYEFRKFCDYWHSVPGARGRKADWNRTYRNWIRKAHEDIQRHAHRNGRGVLSAVDEKALGWQGVGR